MPPNLKKEESTVRKRLLQTGFEEEFIGEDRPPATHYHSSQLLRYIEILLLSPWKVELGHENGYALAPKRTVQITNPASFLAQKILIHEQRNYKDKAKDLLYMHDTIEVFSENLDELQKLFRGAVALKLHRRRVAELEGAADGPFIAVGPQSLQAFL